MDNKPNNERIESFKKMISANKVDELFKGLDSSLLEASNDFILLQSQYSLIKQAKRTQTMDGQTYLQEIGKLKGNLIEFLETLEDGDLKNLLIEGEKSEKKSEKPLDTNDLEKNKEKEKSLYKRIMRVILVFLLAVALLLVVIYIFIFILKRENSCGLKEAGIYLKYDMKKCEKIDEDKIIVISLSTGKVQKSGFFYEKSAFLNRKRYANIDLKKCTQLSIENTSYNCESK